MSTPDDCGCETGCVKGSVKGLCVQRMCQKKLVHTAREPQDCGPASGPCGPASGHCPLRLDGAQQWAARKRASSYGMGDVADDSNKEKLWHTHRSQHNSTLSWREALNSLSDEEEDMHNTQNNPKFARGSQLSRATRFVTSLSSFICIC